MFVYQGNDHDCGFAALKNLLADVHKDENYLYLANEKKNESYNLKEIVDIAAKYNVTLIGKEVDCDHIEEYIKKRTKFLAVIEDDLHQPHLVYVKKTFFKKLVILDPAKGEIMMDIVNFKTLYLRTLLEFQSKGFRRSKCPIKKEEIVPIKDRVILYSLQILSLISVFVALTMVAFDMKFVFTAITLAVYVAAEAVFRIYLQRFMKRFDEKYFNMLVDKSKEEVQYQYRILQERKKYLFLSPLQLISNLIFLLALIILFAFNGKVYLLTIIGLCLLTVIVEGLHYHFTYKKKEQLEYEEKKLLNGHPIEMNNFLNMTYSLVGTYSIKNLINIVASVFGAVFLMLATNNETVNFVLFYFVAIYASLDRLGQVLNYLMLKEYDNKNEAMFRDTFL